MFKFIYQYDEQNPLIEVSISKDSTWSEAIEAFESFLKASGYSETLEITGNDPRMRNQDEI